MVPPHTGHPLVGDMFWAILTDLYVGNEAFFSSELNKVCDLETYLRNFRNYEILKKMSFECLDFFLFLWVF